MGMAYFENTELSTQGYKVVLPPKTIKHKISTFRAKALCPEVSDFHVFLTETFVCFWMYLLD